MVTNMSKYARIENGEVKEVISFNPAGKFAPDFVFVPCDDTVAERDTYNATTGEFTKFVMPTPEAPTIEAATEGEDLADPIGPIPDADA